MICSDISFCKINCKPNWCCHWSTIHRTRYISHNNCIGVFLYVIRQLPPLCFKNTAVFLLVKNFLYNIVWIKRCWINFFIASNSLIDKRLKSILIMLHKCISVNHHCPAWHFRILNFTPTICWHKALNNFNLLSHTAYNSLKIINRIAQFLSCQNA